MDDTKLKKIGAELSKARAKRDEWDRKVKDLERRYREAENTCIHDMVHAANLTPEQLADLIRAASAGQPYVIPAVPDEADDDPETDPDEPDDEKEAFDR